MSGRGELVVGGVEPFTTIDFPGRLAAVVFCQGCPWRCPYCHNTHLQPFRKAGSAAWEDILVFLHRRRGFLDGVVFSGGEPTAQQALEGAIDDVRALGLEAGLHTAGIFPERLTTVLPKLSWVGLDVKAPLDERYDRISGRPRSARLVRQALEILLSANIPFQIRTTVDPERLSERDLREIVDQLQRLGAPPPVLQPKISPPRRVAPG